MSHPSPELLETLSALGVDLSDPASARAAIAALGKALAAAKKSLPTRAAVRFEPQTVKDVSGARVPTGETVLRVQRGGKGQPLLVTQHAARLLVEDLDALRYFAETGEACDLTPREAEEESDEENE